MRVFALATSCIVVLAWLAVPRVSAQATGTTTRNWNQETAAAYLDHRMDEWFAKGQQLRTGQGTATCVSCHTVVPYALAWPVLRRAMRVDTLTPQETRLADETRRRVQTFDTNQPLYEAEEEKKGQSRGTEAVVYALILASVDGGRSRPEPSDATRLAMTRLWQTQRADGSWEWLDVGIEPFESIDSAYQGAALAALAVGMTTSLSKTPSARTGIAKLRGYLKTNYSRQSLHNRLWGVLALTSLNDPLTDAREGLVAELQRRQNDDGGWSLEGLGGWRWNRTTAPFQSPGTRDLSLAAKSDGYATGLSVYALRRARVFGDHGVVEKGLEWLRSNQQPVRVSDGEWVAWRAYSLNFDREHGGPKGEPWRRFFMSDAATAFAVLALAASD